MSLAVLLGRTFRKSSLRFTLGALAVVDSALLCTALPRQWILTLTDEVTDVRETGALGCKIHFFLTYYLTHLFTYRAFINNIFCIFCLPFIFFSRFCLYVIFLFIQLPDLTTTYYLKYVCFFHLLPLSPV